MTLLTAPREQGHQEIEMKAQNYESDLIAALEIVQESIDFSAAEGNMRNWVQDALNDSWDEDKSLNEWVRPIINKFSCE